MHPDEPPLDAGLVRRLVAEQFPQWAALPIERVVSSGTDNALFRIGTEFVARLPRIGWAVDDVANEQRWLPVLAPQLPLAVPAPVGVGAPGHGYPWRWSVYRWLPGDNPVVGALPDPDRLARELGAFVRALHRVDPAGGNPASRGGPLRDRDAETRAAIADLRGELDVAAVTAVWDGAIAVPPWTGRPVWIHGDLAPGNLLCDPAGRLTAVIDFGALGIGDPAADLLIAWNLLPSSARKVYRDEVGVDDDTWLRGRGRALTVALLQVPYYRQTNPALAASGRHVIGEVLADASR